MGPAAAATAVAVFLHSNQPSSPAARTTPILQRTGVSTMELARTAFTVRPHQPGLLSSTASGEHTVPTNPAASKLELHQSRIRRVLHRLWRSLQRRTKCKIRLQLPSQPSLDGEQPSPTATSKLLPTSKLPTTTQLLPVAKLCPPVPTPKPKLFTSRHRPI